MLFSSAMLQKRLPAIVLSLLAVAALGSALVLRVPESKARSGFWSDEATYHSMAWSIAHDGDIRYEPRDLERVYEAGYGGGPSGLFLVRNPAGGLYFAKSFAYPLFAAPFVRLLGDNGFFVLHALLLAAMLAAGFVYARRYQDEGTAALVTATYVLGSSATIYFFWLTPEWFNLALVFLATFLWIHKEPGLGRDPLERGWLAGAWTDWAAALLYGVAIFSKPPNALLVLPLFAWLLLRRRWFRAVGTALACGLVVVAMFGLTWASIGDWNYQGGDRWQFNVVTGYPHQFGDRPIEEFGDTMTTAVEDLTVLPPASTIARDLLYVWIGRNGGMLAYLFPAVAALLAFVAAPRLNGRWRSPQALLVGAFLLEVLAIVLVVQGNWIGGGGTIGSRYFVNAYPLLFFALPAVAAAGVAIASWIVWGLFVGPIVLAPFLASSNPSMHTKELPYTLLPTELTILHNLPFNTNSRARRVELDSPPTFYAYFLDDDTYLAERGGFWVKGAEEAEFLLRTVEPAETLTLRIRNRGLPNRVVVRHGGRIEERSLEPNERVEIELPAVLDHTYHTVDGNTSLYRVTVANETATIPLFDTAGSGDHRPLGVFVIPSVDPAFPIGGTR